MAISEDLPENFSAEKGRASDNLHIQCDRRIAGEPAELEYSTFELSSRIAP